MNQCNQCKFYSGDAEQGLCHAVPPKINLAIVTAEWTEEALLDASVRPGVMAEDLGCSFWQTKGK